MLKAAFEQIYGAPYLARMLFAEIGDRPENDLLLRIEYDGSIATNGATRAGARQDFAALSGSSVSADLMESYLKQEHDPAAPVASALKAAVNAWTIGNMALSENGVRELPPKDAVDAERAKHASGGAIEAAMLERDARVAIRYRALTTDEVTAGLAA
jgi:proteasome alpha subunit